MNFFRKLRNKNTSATESRQPIFPGESFTILRVTLPDGWGLAKFNNRYSHYPNKSHFPWLVLIELEIVEKNDNGHPIDTEAKKLNALEEELQDFLEGKHIVHCLGRVTRNGYRDLFYYIDRPQFNQAEVNQFCDNVMRERGIYFTIEMDPEWIAVSAFIK